MTLIVFIQFRNFIISSPNTYFKTLKSDQTLLEVLRTKHMLRGDRACCIEGAFLWNEVPLKPPQSIFENSSENTLLFYGI